MNVIRLMAHQPEYMRSNVARRPVPGPGRIPQLARI